MTLADDILSDTATFYNTDDFGETVNYRPKDPLGLRKDIAALIDPTVDLDSGQFLKSTIEISIDADPTRGIAIPVPGDLLLVRGRVCRLSELLDSAPDGTHDLVVQVGEIE